MATSLGSPVFLRAREALGMARQFSYGDGVKAGWFVLTIVLCSSAPAAEEASRHFHESVKPLIDSRCVSCHGSEEVKGGLRMDSREALLAGGDSGPAVIPGKPSESLVIQAVRHTREGYEMPPKEKLSDKDIAVLERWIQDGVPWPKMPVVSTAEPPPGERIGDAWSDPRNPIVRIFGGQRLDLWSLRPIKSPEVPQLKSGRQTRNPVDAFILAKLESAGLEPSPEADRRTVARRLYFDLTGLPPAPEEITAFLEDTSPGAYERLVDKLLESPRYGEHWARLWLDVIRYSDSNGFDWDEFRPRAWRFRDYVIRAFNSDKPFNQFIREQLAGDELLNGPPKDKFEQDLLVATGYLRMGPQDNSAPLFNEQARSRAELMADLVETTGSAFLGLTMSCCRCHDHKFDPLSQADHFRMRAFFEGVKYADDTPLDLAPAQEAIRRHNAAVDARIKPVQEERDSLRAGVKKRLRAEREAKLTDEERALLTIEEKERSDEQKKLIEEIEKKTIPSDKEMEEAFSEEQKKKHEELSKQLAELKKEKKEFTLGLLMTDAEEPPPVTKLLYQGDYKAEREPVQPGFISALDPNPAPIRKAANPKTLGRRATLAEWISSPQNPLTARVLVNRVWQMHFTEPIVATPNDFGLAGAKPSHPELLDFLASEFIRENWSVKKLHRLIVTSATYKQVSAPNHSKFAAGEVNDVRPLAEKIDSGNKLLWRQHLRRLSAEQLRDSLLAVSGRLRDSSGGPPIWPELPAEVLVANPAFLDDNETKTKGWYPSPPEKQGARSVYLVQKRTVRVPFMETFDLPENATSCARRNESIVAPQALSLLNSPLALQAAKSFAARLETEGGSRVEDKVKRGFMLAFQRKPEPEELRACAAFLKDRSTVEFCRALLNSNEFLYVD